MAYAILRTAKLKSMGSIGGSLAHTYRTREIPNADAQRDHLNEHHDRAQDPRHSGLLSGPDFKSMSEDRLSSDKSPVAQVIQGFWENPNF